MQNKIKKITALILALLAVSSVLCGCATTVQTEADSVISEITSVDTVSACLYSEVEKLLIVPGGDEFSRLMQGEWKKRDGVGKGEKVLSVTVAAQYEVCFFDDGVAMIYYGVCGVFEKDRQYFDVSLENGLDTLVEYVNNIGIDVKYDIDSFTDGVEKADKISAFIGDDEFELSGGKALAALMSGEWKKRNDKGSGETVLTIELPMQYGVSFFDDGTARIYCNELKKGRQYFDVSLDAELDTLVKYVKENGVLIEDETAEK